MEHMEKIRSLERHLERANIEMEELKKTHKQELDAKLKELRNELHNVAKERQEFLKAEVKRQRRKAEENLLACWSKDTELSKEQNKTTELQRKVEELNAKLGEHAKNSAAASREKEDTAPTTLPRVSKITIEELKKQVLYMGGRIASKDKENQMLKASTMEQTEKITSLERHLERATIEMEELKKTHKQELDAKLKELQNELHNVAKERQEFLKAELACWSKDTELSKEQNKTTELQRKVEELNAKLGEHAKNSAAASREKEDTAPTTLPRVSKITIEELKKQVLYMGGRIASKDKENQMLKASTMEQTEKITSLERHLERATIEMEELKKTHKQELDAKLKELRNELHNVAKERQEFPKAEVKRHQRNAEENLLACWSKDTELSKEQNKTTELQRKVEELNAKLGEHAKNSAAASSEKEDTTPTTPLTLPRVSKITGVDEPWDARSPEEELLSL